LNAAQCTCFVVRPSFAMCGLYIQRHILNLIGRKPDIYRLTTVKTQGERIS
jgi:hypothetical protein